MHNNLKRVKGILSARLGTLVPKFNTGGKTYTKLLSSGTIYSLDGQSWFTDDKFFNPYTDTSSMEFLLAALQEIIPEESSVIGPSINLNTMITIPGRNPKEGNPQALLESIPQAKGLNPSNTSDLALLKTDPIGGGKIDVSSGMQMVEQKQKEYDNVEAKAQKLGNVAHITSQAILGLGNILGALQAASDSTLTKGIDSGVDLIGGTLSSMGGVAGAVGLGLLLASAAGQIIGGITGGTDLMTDTDKFFDSGIGTILGGWINQLWGQNSNSFGIDLNVALNVGSSYGGSMYLLNDAASKANKKYGLFSSNARKKANEDIALAKQTLSMMGDISKTATDQRLAVQSMGEQAGLAYSMMTDGGYNLKYTYAAKHGGIMSMRPIVRKKLKPIELEWEPQVELNWELPTFKDGGSVEFVEELEWIPEFKDGGKSEEHPKEYLEFKASLPDNQRNTSEDDYRTYLYWQLWGKPKNFQYTLEHPDESGNYMYTWDNSDNSYHASTIAWKDGVGYFMKPKHHSTLKYELDWFNKGLITEEGGRQREMTPEESKEWEEFRSNYELVDDGDFYKYIPKNKQGGSLGDSDIPETEETTQKNVIPEGALHKNKHHMEHAEGLTKKGIPVVDEDGELQAEIEHSEIIFTLEVTKKLEEYYEIFYSEESTNKEKEQAALDAGKLLVYQILENTEDRTGLIESCKKGGSLTLKKSTDDLIEEVLEWMPTIVIVEEQEKSKEEEHNKEEDKSEAKNELSDKDKMKEAIREVLIELLLK